MTDGGPQANRSGGQPRLAQPTLYELFEDPLVRLIMVSDGVEPRRLWNLLMETAQHIGGREAIELKDEDRDRSPRHRAS